MDKIYSRKRIKFKYFDKKQNRLLSKILNIVIILVIAVVTLIRSIGSIEPIFNMTCRKEAKNIATIISNNQATAVMKKYEYDDMASIVKNENGSVAMVKANIITINKIISDVAVEIQKELESVGDLEVNVKLGTFTGIKLFLERGPEVKFKVSCKGDVSTDFKSEFIEAGINQTLHRMYLEVTCDVSILTPFDTIDEQIVNQVIIAENMIVGTTPDTYYNFSGTSNMDSNMLLEGIN